MKSLTHVCVAFALFTLVAPRATAQDSAVAPPPSPGREIGGFLKRAGGMLESAFKRPVHPVVKGVASGGGLGGGIGYDAPTRGPWEFDADAVTTMRGYWSLTAVGGYHTKRFDAEAYARGRDMTQLSYFGAGNDAMDSNRTNFRLEDRVVGALGSFDVSEWLRLGGRIEQYSPEIGVGKSTQLPSIEEQFNDAQAPGLLVQPKFMRTQALAEFHLLPGAGEALHQGTKLRLTYSGYTDRDLDRYSFRTYDIEVQQRFAALFPHHRLTLHALMSSAETDAGQEVPFYLQRTLGGKGNVRSVHDDLIGSDGTAATLRGFKSFRFRDRNLLLLQAEYRLPVWGPVEGTVFVDAGKVGPRRADLDLNGLHSNYGFSVSLMKGPATALRTDVAFGREGTRLLLSIGRDIVP